MKSAYGAALAWVLLAGTAPVPPAPAYDIVIRDGRVLDGAGNPWVRADVAVKDGRIVAVGEVEGRGTREIAANGRYVTPGFIDMMDQSGRVFLEDGSAENKLAQGVTTVIAGEAGTPVPAAGIAAYFDRLQKQGIAINFGTYYASTQAREMVMGDADGRPTPAQTEAMKDQVRLAMRAGALGVTSALIYAPSSFQSTDDLVALAGVAAQCKGIYASHIRNENEGVLGAVNEAISIGERSGARVEIFHIKVSHRPSWGKLMPQVIKTIDDARARGVDIAADQYVYPASGTGIEVTVPAWVWKDGREKGIERLRDPALRDRLKREVAAGPVDGWVNQVEAAGGWENIRLVNSYNDTYRQYEGKSFGEIGRLLKRHPADAAWDIWLAALPKRGSAVYFVIGDEDLENVLRQLWVSIGSDASAMPRGPSTTGSLAHPRAYGNFSRVLSRYVRERGVLTLPDAVRKMTSWPATRMGFNDRGLVRVGMRADLLVFDLDKVRDNATFEKPVQMSTGMDHVIVNGTIAVEDGRPTGSRSGTVLRRPCTKV